MSTKLGILVISHGSREAEWVGLVDRAVTAAASAAELTGVPVYSSFLEIVEGRLIQDGVDALEALGVTELFVLPLFVSSGSTHVDEIGQAFGFPRAYQLEGDLGTFRTASATTVHMGLPIDDDPDIAELLLSNIAELSDQPSEESLLLVAHGSKEAGFHGRWRQGLTSLAARMQDLGGFRRAEIAMLLPNQAGCVLKAMQRREPEAAVIVVPIFLSTGYFTNHVIPNRLTGLTYRYNGLAMLPHPAIERWMQRQMIAWTRGAGGREQ
ncbi:sirohydrochlorin chelatase [Paenibacillus sp. GCM10023252]|uniref:sirohydrochlorin chelatase n=1 Tax=Paenibacillus sp. GCM10023252 TaxID=3252649 RepID=UPI00360D1BDD